MYLTLAPTNKRKEKLKKSNQLYIKIRDLILSISKISDHYDEKYMKIEINSYVPLNKTIEIPSMTIVFWGIFQENNKYYSQVFLNECLYKL